MDELLALETEQRESATLRELLEIVDEWLGCSQSALVHGEAHHGVATTASAADAMSLACSESVDAAAGSTEPALPTAIASWSRMNGEHKSDMLALTVTTTPASGTKRPRERNTAVDMRRRLRKKAEHSFLRMQVRDLEFQLAALQQSRRSRSRMVDTNVNQHAFPSIMAETPDGYVSDKQRHTLPQELRQAMVANRRLKARVTKIDALLQSLYNAVRSGSSNDEGGVLSKACKHHPLAGNSSPDQCASDTERTMPLETVHMDVDYVLEKFPPLTADSLVCSSETTIDAFGSPRFEMKTATTVGCDIQTFSPMFAERFHKISRIARIVLRCLTTKQRVFEHSSSREVRYLNSTTVLRSSGVVYKHEQEDDDGIMFTSSSKMYHPSGALGFRGRSWMVVTRSPQSPSGMTTVRTLYELTPEQISSSVSTIDGENPDKVRAYLLAALSESLRAKHRRLQRMLLIETGRSELAAVLGM